MLHAYHRGITASTVAALDRGARQGQFQLQRIVGIAAVAGHQALAGGGAALPVTCEGRPCKALANASRRCNDCTRGPAPSASSASRSCTSAWRRVRPSLSGRSASAVAAWAYRRRAPSTSSA
ncbi:hypothetical protein G6F55_014026 [Rhizopus delemar]|nr:hypothetical protein G6F55_014026 [Rhizopus delemar]